MDSLPDALLQYILSYMSNARDVALCNCVSKRWKESVPFLRSLYFPRNSFDNYSGLDDPENVMYKMISAIIKLEELVVYTPFSSASLGSWLSIIGPSLRQLELRMDNISSPPACHEHPSKLDCIIVAENLESMKLWGVLMTQTPKWNEFHRLINLEIVGAKLEDPYLDAALKACPNLTNLLLLGCEGVRSVSIELPKLERCKLDFVGPGYCSLSIDSPRIELLEVQGCCWVRVPETSNLTSLSISNNTGRVYMVEFGKLAALEFLSIRGVQWSWNAVSKMLELARDVKHLFMKVEFTGDFEELEPFPEIDLVEFFNNHPKLEKFDIHGAMFAALCQKNSLRNVDPEFVIPCLEKAVISVRSPLNAEQKMNTLESLIKYGRNMKTMVIKILQMKSSHSSADDFFDDICKFRHVNRKVVRVE